MARYELLEEIDFPFPLGGCFGYWGYDLKNFVEPKLARRAINDLGLPDCVLGFYSSLVVFDHLLSKTWVISTGLKADGSRTVEQQRKDYDFWERRLAATTADAAGVSGAAVHAGPFPWRVAAERRRRQSVRALTSAAPVEVRSNLSRAEFLERVERCQRHIWSGDIYQVNLS